MTQFQIEGGVLVNEVTKLKTTLFEFYLPKKKKRGKFIIHKV